MATMKHRRKYKNDRKPEKNEVQSRILYKTKMRINESLSHMQNFNFSM